MDHILGNRCKSEKWKRYWVCFTGKTILFRRDFQTLNARQSNTTLYLNVHQFRNTKYNLFVREMAVKRIMFCLESIFLYEQWNFASPLLMANTAPSAHYMMRWESVLAWCYAVKAFCKASAICCMKSILIHAN